MKHRFARSLFSSAICLLLVAALAPLAAGGVPIDDKRAQARQLQAQIEANGDRIAALGEQYNGATLAVAEAQRKIDEAQTRRDAARAASQRIKRTLQNRAVELYKGAGNGTPLQAIDVTNVRELASRSKYGSVAADRDDTALHRLQRAEEELAIQQRGLEAQRAKADADRRAAETAKREIETANASQEALLQRVKGELATLVEQERQRREAAARQAAQQAQRRTQASSSGRAPASGAVDPGSVGAGNDPNVPVSGGVTAVIAYARAQLGKPYVFATAGPNTFDCSGLTKMAWAQAGVSMPHFSGAQFNMFTHVPIGALQPGDLVFKGPGGRDHVALYIGGGMQIAATHTGDYVRLQPLSSNLSGAVRPG